MKKSAEQLRTLKITLDACGNALEPVLTAVNQPAPLGFSLGSA